MTRREQIEESACQQPEAIGGMLGLPKDLLIGFIRGAEWADKNPPDSRMAMKIEHRCQDLEKKLSVAVEEIMNYRLKLIVLGPTDEFYSDSVSLDMEMAPEFVEEVIKNDKIYKDANPIEREIYFAFKKCVKMINEDKTK